MLAAEGASFVLGEIKSLPFHCESIECEQGIVKRFTHTSQTLGGLHRSEHAGDTAQHTHCGTCLHIGNGWRLGEQAAVASGAGTVCHHLAGISADAPHAERLSEHHTGIVDQIFGGKVVCPVNHKVVWTNEFQRIVFAEINLMLGDVEIGVDGF